MGATRESSWSGGIFAAWSCGEAACAERGDGIVASVSPGTMAIVQTTPSRYRKVAAKNLRLGFMASSALDRPFQLDESIEHEHAHSFCNLSRTCRLFFDTRS